MSAIAGVLAQKYKAGRAVRRSSDAQRIEALPRRSSYLDMAEVLTLMLQRDDLPRDKNGVVINPYKLRAMQAWALSEMVECKGLLLSAEVGSGKTIPALLAPVVLGARRPLLLIPADLRKKTYSDIDRYSRYYKLHSNLRILSYQELSRVKQANVLDQLLPDLIVGDEIHKLKSRSSAVTRRVLRYFEEHKRFPTGLSTGNEELDTYRTMFVGMTGTLTKRSLRDYAHLADLALGEGSPLPRSYMDLEDWADALDEGVPDAIRPEPGALWRLCAYEVQGDKVVYSETPREGFRRRLLDTKGYVATQNTGVAASLSIFEHPIDNVPNEVKAMFARIRTSWKTPGNETEQDEIISALDMARHLRELAMGFYYRWKWPAGKVDREWLMARRKWRSFVRSVIRSSGETKWGRMIFDTELQVANACAKGQISTVVDDPLVTGEVEPEDVYAKWREMRSRTGPETEAVWVSDFMVQEALKWLQKTEASNDGQGILWVEHVALVEALRKVWPRVYGAGESDILTATRTCVASQRAHGTGKNLEVFNKNLFLTVPANSNDCEQTFGRTHRSTQKADEVHIGIVMHCIELWNALKQARSDAAYVEETTGQQQRLRFADITVPTEEEVISRAFRRPGAWPGHAALPGCRGDQDPLWCVEMDKLIAK